MIIYTTKYALTKGIEKIDADVEPGKTLATKGLTCYHKPYWHETREAAIEHADQLRFQHIASLGRKIDKLRKVNFSETAPQ